MFDFTGVQLDRLVVHVVGNKYKGESVKFSKHAVEISHDFTKEVLLKYFTSPFKGNTFYNFSPVSALDQNLVCKCIMEIFENMDTFYDNSIKIAEYLHERSDHPKINEGEVYIIKFSECVVEGELVDAIGIFKSENK